MGKEIVISKRQTYKWDSLRFSIFEFFHFALDFFHFAYYNFLLHFI